MIPKTPIRLGEAVELHPQGFYQTNVLAFGGPGAGKTTLQRLFYERAPKQWQQVIVDTEDELHTLRSDGREYIIMGGDFADAPGLETMDWYSLAGVIVKTGANFIFQINDWPIDEQREFIGQLVKGLLATPRTEWRPMIFGLDETDQFAPNGSTVESSEALVMLAKRGRKRGWSCLFATQRISMLSADLRGMCSNKAIGVANQMLDVKAGAQEIGVSPTSAEAKQLLSLRKGHFYLGGPAFDVRPPALFHTDMSESRAPEPGSAAPPPSKSSAAIIKALAALPKPEEAKPDFSPLPGSGEVRVEYRTDPADIERAKHEGMSQGMQRVAANVAATLRNLAGQFDDFDAHALQMVSHGKTQVIELPRETKAEQAPHTAVHQSRRHIAEAVRTPPIKMEVTGGMKPNGKLALTTPAEVILQAFAENYPRAITFKHAHKLMARSVTSSNFGRVVKELTESGLLVNPRGDFWTVADLKAKSWGLVQKPKNPADVIALWRTKLQPAQARMLDAIAERRHFANRGEWAEASGVSPTSSNVGRVAGELAALELIIENERGIHLHPDLT